MTGDFFAGRGSPARELLYLAMAHSKLGEVAKADDFRQQATQYLADFPEEKPDLQPLLDELETVFAEPKVRK